MVRQRLQSRGSDCQTCCRGAGYRALYRRYTRPDHAGPVCDSALKGQVSIPLRAVLKFKPFPQLDNMTSNLQQNRDTPVLP